MKELICLIGLSGSGKSSVGRYLETKGYFYFSPGNQLKLINSQIEEHLGYKYPYNDLIMSVEKVYEKGFNQFTAELLKQQKHEKVVLDSLININNAEEIFQLYKNINILTIFSPLEERIKRVVKREGYERLPREKAAEIVMNIDSYELGLGAGNLMAMSDYIISNNGDMDKLSEAIDDLLKNLKPGDIHEKLKVLKKEPVITSKVVINTKPFEMYKERYL